MVQPGVRDRDQALSCIRISKSLHPYVYVYTILVIDGSCSCYEDQSEIPSHRASRKQEIPTALEAEQKHGAFTSVTEN